MAQPEALFIVQREVLQDRQQILAALRAERLPYQIASFDRANTTTRHTLIPLGAVAFAMKAHREGWGGVWRPETLSYDAYEAGWGDRMVNAGAARATLGTITPYTGARFIRPVADDKAFNGAVVHAADLDAWRQHAVDYNGDPTNEDTPVVVAAVELLRSEWRCFVVNGEVCAGARYYRYGRLSLSVGVPAHVAAYAQAAVRAWTPAPAFVLDVGETPGGLRIIEAGCVNCAGFYGADPRPVVRGLATLLHEHRS